MRLWVPVAALALALSPLMVVHPVRIRGGSMAPALREGDLRWALRAWVSAAPRRGEVWVVESPEGPAVKRVVGLPGETITWRGPDLWINGQRFDEPWVELPERDGEGLTICGHGYLVLGDHRAASQDGRQWGALSRSRFLGRILGEGTPSARPGETTPDPALRLR